MYACNPLASERYYLRLLLTVIPRAQSFKHLQTIASHEYSIFREACTAHGLLDNDHKWVACFTEASLLLPDTVSEFFLQLLLYIKRFLTHWLYGISFANIFVMNLNID